jgi:CheY-like chemotaxis protein/anti-sigma regulatory factor (Ser/Thr protein kinase)
MHAILGFAQLLDSGPAPALGGPQRGHLREILRAGERLLSLINELLDLARIEAGHLLLQPETVDVHALLLECMRTIEPLAQRHVVQLVQPVPAADAGCVFADRERLRQVLLNLLSNAIKHNRRGGQVRVQCEHDSRATLRITVSDTGVGLDATQKDRLFHAFERLGADKAAIQGTGIGLALSKRLVELMHGQIGLDSELGVGSRFWVRLARADSTTAAPAAAADGGARTRLTGTVLYIEDDAVNVLLMEAMIEQQTQLRLISAALPETGLEMARAQRPDLILLDIQLPGIDGYEVLRRLRADSATRDIPVFAVSANAIAADIARGRAAGFDDYLTKPIDQPLLVAALRRALG